MKFGVAILFVMPSIAAAAPVTEADIDAIGRVVYAEAANQPLAGKVAVLDTILNRLSTGRFGDTVTAVIEQRNAFEPVTRAGGWRNLPALTDTQRVEFGTIISLKAAGLVGDASNGATFFQNPAIVAKRAKDGSVSKSLVGFNGMPATAVIADHTFYSPGPVSAARRVAFAISGGRHPVASLFVGEGGEEVGGSKDTVLVFGEDNR